MTRFIRSATVEVDVDIYDDDISDDDLREMCDERGITTSVESEKVREMYYAFKLGKTGRAIELAREIAQDYTGMIL